MGPFPQDRTIFQQHESGVAANHGFQGYWISIVNFEISAGLVLEALVILDRRARQHDNPVLMLVSKTGDLIELLAMFSRGFPDVIREYQKGESGIF